MKTIGHATVERNSPSGLLFGVGILLISCVFSPGILQAGGVDNQAAVRNVHFRAEHGKVVIAYELTGRADRLFNVRLVLRKESDSTYEYEPKAITGDAGVVRPSGMEMQITWSIRSEFPGGLAGSDYYFVVRAEEVEERSVSTNYLTEIGAGVAVLAAAGMYFLVHGNHKPAAESSVFPSPPGRPQ